MTDKARQTENAEVLDDDALDSAQGAGDATIDFVETSGGNDETASGHRRILPVKIMKRID